MNEINISNMSANNGVVSFQNGKVVQISIHDILSGVQEQYLQFMLIASAILLVYTLWGLFVKPESYIAKAFTYYLNLFSFMMALSLFIITLVYFENWGWVI